MGKNLRGLALLSNVLIGSILFVWGWAGGADDIFSLARIGIGLGAIGLANIATAIYKLVDKSEA